jgi:hypothetical protein
MNYFGLQVFSWKNDRKIHEKCIILNIIKVVNINHVEPNILYRKMIEDRMLNESIE